MCHPTSSQFGVPLCYKNERNLEEESKEKTKYFILLNALAAAFCVLMAALAAGLTMGLLALDPLDLLIKIRAPQSEEEGKYAKTLLPIVRQHHRLLVTLLLINAISNEALPIFLDSLVPSYVAIIMSVTLVLFFGEIIPSAFFTGPNQMKLSSTLAPLVNLSMFLLAPVAVPIANLLDHFLGHEDMELYNRGELKAMVRILHEERKKIKQLSKKLVPYSMGKTSDVSIDLDEVTMVEGALNMKTQTVQKVYKPLSHVYSLSADCLVDENLLVEIYSTGFSRIPIRKGEGHNSFIGILNTRKLIVIDSVDKRALSSLPLLQPHCVSSSMNMMDLLNMFQEGRRGEKGGHLALVCSNPELAAKSLAAYQPTPPESGVMGIVTMEDVIEQLLQESVLDEGDRSEQKDIRISARVVGKWRSFVTRKKAQRSSKGEEEIVLQRWKTYMKEKKTERVEDESTVLLPKKREP